VARHHDLDRPQGRQGGDRRRRASQPARHDREIERAQVEQKLERYPDQLKRACVELAKDWRTDRYLRRLEAMMLVADRTESLVLTGNGDVLEPEHGLMGIGSGGNFALAAARALIETDMDAETVARRAMQIASKICVYTNDQIVLESLDVE
jgi:ATP-dependent HslUV protease subunit HslV